MKPILPLLPQQRIQIDLPGLIRLGAYARMIKADRFRVRASQGSGYLSAFKGRGMEYDESRLYQPGDDIRSIDWKVTARTDKPYTKVYREERECPVFISVDNRQTMQFATRGAFKAVRAKQLAALLAWAALQRSDRVGGQIFSDKACREIKPGHGRSAVLKYLKLLSDENASAVADLTTVLMRLQHHARPGSRIYLISDFRGIQSAEKALVKLAQHCDVALIQVYDPLEKALPPSGRYLFTDGERELLVDASDRQRVLRYQHNFQAREAYLEQVSRKYTMRFVSCSTQDDPVRILS